MYINELLTCNIKWLSYKDNLALTIRIFSKDYRLCTYSENVIKYSAIILSFLEVTITNIIVIVHHILIMIMMFLLITMIPLLPFSYWPNVLNIIHGIRHIINLLFVENWKWTWSTIISSFFATIGIAVNCQKKKGGQ